MSKKITLYVVRHGETLLNKLDKVQGWCDSPLTENGKKVAQFLGKGLSEVAFDAVYCSTLRRTLQTARTILETKNENHLAVTELEGLRESCFGSFESDTNFRMWQSVAEELGFRTINQMSEALFAGQITHADIHNSIQTLDTMGMAETFAQVEHRTQTALRQIADAETKRGSSNVLVVAHGMCICCMLMSLGGKKHLRSHLENASVSLVEFENGTFAVRSMNDMSYVEKGKNTP